MKHIFYIMAIAPILWELQCILSPIKTSAQIKSMKGKKFDEYSPNQKAIIVFMLGYLFWIFVGLLSFQWPLFLLMFALGMIPKKYWVVRLIDSAITVVILMFIIINAYHLNIDVWQLIVNYFNI